MKKKKWKKKKHATRLDSRGGRLSQVAIYRDSYWAALYIWNRTFGDDVKVAMTSKWRWRHDHERHVVLSRVLFKSD